MFLTFNVASRKFLVTHMACIPFLWDSTALNAFLKALISSVQFSRSVVPTLCNPVDCSTPGLPVFNAACLKPELLFPTATLVPLLPKFENFIFLVNETLGAKYSAKHLNIHCFT